MPDNENTVPLPPPLPPHWKVPEPQHPLFGPLIQLLFRALCLISVHRPSLDHHWKSKYDDREWDKHMSQLVGQINNSNVACGLLLATTAVFLTTPPPMTSILDYGTTPAYVLALVSFSHALGGILTGTAVIAIYQSCDREWSRKVLSATRLRLYLILLLIAWPSVSLFLSIIFLMAAMLHAVLTPSVVWLRTIVGLELMLWIWALPAFIFCTLPVRMPQGDHEATPPSQSTPTVSPNGSRSALIVSGNDESPAVSPDTTHYHMLPGSNSGEK